MRLGHVTASAVLRNARAIVDGMIDVVMLGTGTPDPDPRRSGSGVAVVQNGRWIMVDCGRGVTQRAIEAGLDLTAIEAVVLTHHHSDHVSDLATLAITRWTAGSLTPLVVAAPSGPCARYASRCLDAFEDQAFYAQANQGSPRRPELAVLEFLAADEPAVVVESGDFSISAALVDHHPIEAAVGYRITSGGRAIAVSGDTATCPGVERLAASADLLIHQALRSDRMSSKALTWNASAFSVGALAHSLGIRRLVLTHLMPAPESADDDEAFRRETRSGGYAEELIIATDLLRIPVL